MSHPSPRAAEVLVQCLLRNGFDRAFCVPGESYLALLDALRDEARFDIVTCRHEGGAALMAVADAKLTGRPGLAMVSRGPGATNAAMGVHVADQDATPMILLIGQAERRNLGRGAFQEVDYERMFGGMARWVYQVDDPQRLPEVLARAVRAATGPTPGPVVLSIPEDLLTAPCTAPPVRATPTAAALAQPADIERTLALLRAAKAPLLLVGSALQAEPGRRALMQVSQGLGLPVAVTNKQHDLFPNLHPHYVCHVGAAVPPAMAQVLRESDLVLAVGTRLGDISSQHFSLPRAPLPDQPLVHVHADPTVVGRHHQVDVPVAADPALFLTELTRAAGQGPALPDWAPWRGRLVQTRDAVGRWTPLTADDGVDFGHAVAAVRERLAADAIVAGDAGNFITWVHAFLPLDARHRFLGATCGAMGLGIPAAVAAALRHPGRQVVAFAGDGGAMMTGNELAVAVARGARLRIVISNNRAYGTIRTHQERHFPGRDVATALRNPDFAAWARSFGAAGFTVQQQQDVAATFDAAFATEGPALIDVRTSLQIISANNRVATIASAP